jgi:hypothetical protein
MTILALPIYRRVLFFYLSNADSMKMSELDNSQTRPALYKNQIGIGVFMKGRTTIGLKVNQSMSS